MENKTLLTIDEIITILRLCDNEKEKHFEYLNKLENQNSELSNVQKTLKEWTENNLIKIESIMKKLEEEWKKC